MIDVLQVEWSDGGVSHFPLEKYPSLVTNCKIAIEASVRSQDEERYDLSRSVLRQLERVEVTWLRWAINKDVDKPFRVNDGDS